MKFILDTSVEEIQELENPYNPCNTNPDGIKRQLLPTSQKLIVLKRGTVAAFQKLTLLTVSDLKEMSHEN